jgi:hypothetical protein
MVYHLDRGCNSVIFVRIIDENGLFIEDGFVEELSEFTIETPVPQGLYKPKWDGTQWIEGLTQDEIKAIVNTVVEPTLEEKNRADIDYLAIMTGVEL